MSVRNRLSKAAIALSLVMATSATAEFDESVISMPRLEKNAGAEAITGMPLDPADFKEEAGNPLTAVLVVKVIVRVGFKTRQVAALRNQGGRICR